jgi:hypothetical protein
LIIFDKFAYPVNENLFLFLDNYPKMKAPPKWAKKPAAKKIGGLSVMMVP